MQCKVYPPQTAGPSGIQAAENGIKAHSLNQYFLKVT